MHVSPWYPVLSPFWPRQYTGFLAAWLAGDSCGVCGSDHESEKRVALTFDDGPVPGVTDRILDALREQGARATFFMIGRAVEANPELARRVQAEGHEVGNHTQTHPRLGKLAAEDVRREAAACQEVLRQHLGQPARWFRPPYGSLRADQVQVILQQEMSLAYWNNNAKDWRQSDPDRIHQRVTGRLCPGQIVVLHDRLELTAEALPRVLERMLQQGFRPVTLSELVNSGFPPSPAQSR